jgi:hypothetical protein
MLVQTKSRNGQVTTHDVYVILMNLVPQLHFLAEAETAAEIRLCLVSVICLLKGL